MGASTKDDRIARGQIVAPADGTASEIFTVGHSTGSFEEFLARLEKHRITVLVDVRARPHNSFVPQFNRDRMKMQLLERQIVYVYLGDRLGRQPEGTSMRERSRVDVLEIEQTPQFLEGLEWLAHEAAHGRLCLLCGEADPETCHRDFLIAKNLIKRGIRVLHILPGGDLEAASPDLFHLPGGSHGEHPDR